MNSVSATITGYVAALPKELESGDVTFRLLVNKTWKDARGKRMQKTTAYECYIPSVRESLCNTAMDYIRKGQNIQVVTVDQEPNAWKNSDGTIGVSIKCQVSSLTLGEGGQERDEESSGNRRIVRSNVREVETRQSRSTPQRPQRPTRQVERFDDDAPLENEEAGDDDMETTVSNMTPKQRQALLAMLKQDSAPAEKPARGRQTEAKPGRQRPSASKQDGIVV